MRFLTAILVFWATATAGALAQTGQPHDAGVNLQRAATPMMERITDFHTLVLVIVTLIVLVVTALLIYVMVRFRAKANPEPSQFSHNTLIEVIWTAVPVLILFIIAIPSFRLLYFNDVVPEADMTIKVTGYQWYWGYEYPDQGIGEYLSNMIPDDEIDPAAGQVRLLSVDYPMVIPVDTVVRVQVTAADVIHAYAMPAFGVKIDAVPGRLNETWIEATETGVFYGQCSELCGQFHAFMPIEIHVVSQDVYEQWSAAVANDPDSGNAILAEFQSEQRDTRLAAR
ncbi:MAG: cytochrome c oxidase subunit II [Maricaulis sp.]|jgi:cytochrome c oxidase subunit 2|nr:cytochrome c oxidase subunit II [Maricaulis sp.]HAQ35376.1 cytochrome c oxidase subunit II [Alphaproteobacteria bacterium]|tara:strand:- start:105 stop:953 length:849 start_codon:yes stop_codon:yes gene_type:complete